MDIINKLQIITNNIAAANTCSVPLSFIFLRGQGIKVLVWFQNNEKDKYLIPVIKYDKEILSNKNRCGHDGKEDSFEYELEEEDKPTLDDYEGAIVLKPHPGIYLKKYIVVFRLCFTIPIFYDWR